MTNALKSEPINRHAHFFADLIQHRLDTLRDQATAIEILEFDRFLEMKSNFLQNIHMEWLIEDHLTRRDALDMVRLTEQALPKLVRVEF